MQKHIASALFLACLLFFVGGLNAQNNNGSQNLGTGLPWQNAQNWEEAQSMRAQWQADFQNWLASGAPSWYVPDWWLDKERVGQYQAWLNNEAPSWYSPGWKQSPAKRAEYYKWLADNGQEAYFLSRILQNSMVGPNSMGGYGGSRGSMGYRNYGGMMHGNDSYMGDGGMYNGWGHMRGYSPRNRRAYPDGQRNSWWPW